MGEHVVIHLEIVTVFDHTPVEVVTQFVTVFPEVEKAVLTRKILKFSNCAEVMIFSCFES